MFCTVDIDLMRWYFLHRKKSIQYCDSSSVVDLLSLKMSIDLVIHLQSEYCFDQTIAFCECRQLSLRNIYFDIPLSRI